MPPLSPGFQPVIYDHRGNPVRKRYDDMAVPTVVTFGSILKGGWDTFFHGKWDEALKKGREHALKMRRDAHIFSILQERYLGVVGLKWHLGVEDDYDPAQLWVKDHLTKAIQRTPRLRRLFRYLLEAVWYGRYGSQVKWRWQPVESERPDGKKKTVKTLLVDKHYPVNGDKIGHHLDHTPYVLVHAGEGEEQLPKDSRWDATYTTEGGRGLLLRGSWRERFLIHTHEPEDADFFDAESAEAVHGVGVRSRIFWVDWLKSEWLAWVVDYLERVGLGVTIFLYPSGNPAAKAEAERAAHEQSRRSVIVWPYLEGEQGKGAGVQRVETPTGGASVLLQMIQYVDQIEERLIIGQTLSSDSEGSGLGGTGVAMLHAATKQRIIAWDAENLAETLTSDLVDVIRRWTFPWADFPVNFMFDVIEPDPERALGAASMLYNLNVPIREDEVRAIGGFAKPEPDDDVILSPQALQMRQAEDMQGQGQSQPGGPQPGVMPPGMAPGAPQPQPQQGGGTDEEALLAALAGGGGEDPLFAQGGAGRAA